MFPLTYGLLGQHLQHSFSPQFFNEKFLHLGLPHQYVFLERPSLAGLRPWLKQQHPNLAGFNVTIPYKQAIFAWLDELDASARAVGALNTVLVLPGGRWRGYNTDVSGFARALQEFLGGKPYPPALILGTGGASLAVQHVLLQQLPPTQVLRVSRAPAEYQLTYADVTPERMKAHPLLVNCTPLGMHPDVGSYPPIPYDAFTSGHYAFDLVYNPAVTQFMSKAAASGARTQNGHSMLVYQAEAAWAIWQQHQQPAHR